MYPNTLRESDVTVVVMGPARIQLRIIMDAMDYPPPGRPAPNRSWASQNGVIQADMPLPLFITGAPPEIRVPFPNLWLTVRMRMHL